MHAAMSRSELTTQLQQTLRTVISRRMGLALIGEAGIGKTQMSQHLLAAVFSDARSGPTAEMTTPATPAHESLTCR